MSLICTRLTAVARDRIEECQHEERVAACSRLDRLAESRFRLDFEAPSRKSDDRLDR